MKIKNLILVLVAASILASCTPASSIPTKTAAPISSSTPIPTAAIAPTSTLENPTATSTPTPSLSAEGPWLLYVHNSPRPGMLGSDEVPAEFILLNQDGSARTSITSPPCYGEVGAFLMDSGNSANYMAQYEGGLYLFRPSEATGMLVYEKLWYSVCQTFFSGNEKGGLLAAFYQAAKNVSPELILYELPGGKIRERFPLVRCSKDTDVCEKFRSNWPEMMGQQPQWSPNGR